MGLLRKLDFVVKITVQSQTTEHEIYKGNKYKYITGLCNLSGNSDAEALKSCITLHQT